MSTDKTIGLFTKKTNLELAEEARVDDTEETRGASHPFTPQEVMDRCKAAVFPNEMAFNGKDVRLISKGNKNYLAVSVWEKDGVVFHWAYLFLTAGQVKKLKAILEDVC